MQAGWQGLFAIEKDRHAFETLSTNLIAENSGHQFDWPTWLPKRRSTSAGLLRKYPNELKALRGKVDLLVGGPPCQGFSTAGRRIASDPRNRLMMEYIRLVEHIQPRMVLVENVRGFTMDFKGSGKKADAVNYSQRLKKALSSDYFVFTKMLVTSEFGVPQRRKRFFLIAFRRADWVNAPRDPFELIEASRTGFLRAKNLPSSVSAKSAISDLEISRGGRRASKETPGYDEIVYLRPMSTYQRLMRMKASTPPQDLRLARHRPEIAKRFAQIIELCHDAGRLNVSIDSATRERFGLNKHAIRVLDPHDPAPTITSLPDDLLHYSEPRTLTVRENARLQSFPDWFCFKGKYTTGGKLRRKEVPRFTQVANAVPPLVAEAIGAVLAEQLPS